MQSGLRPAARSLRGLRPQRLRPARRHASDSHGSGHGHGHHAAPVNESFGTGFYLSIGAIPASYLLYTLTAAGKDGQEPWFSRVIAARYNEYSEQFARRNETHTRAIEQAASDRLLFLSESNRNTRHIELMFPEQFNVGSPWNVPAGHGHANLDALIAKYQRDANELQDRKLRELRENRVPVEQPVQLLTQIRPRADS